MADNTKAIPIRSEKDGADSRVHVKIVDGASPDANQATVDSDKNVHVEIHGNSPTGTDKVIRTSELGAVNPDGLYDGTNNTKPASIGVLVSDRVAVPGDSTQTKRPTAVSSGTVTAIDVALHNADGTDFATNPLPSLAIGTHNGQASGTQNVFVNNIRKMILAAHDKDSVITFADFGTKNQRITQIDYTSATIGVGAGFTARKTITYTLVGNQYRRDRIYWSLV